MDNVLYNKLQRIMKDMRSARVREDDNKHLCNMRINNGHGYHKCRKPGVIWFHDTRVRLCLEQDNYIVCEEHAKDIRAYAKYFNLKEQTLDDYITYNVVYKVMHT